MPFHIGARAKANDRFTTSHASMPVGTGLLKNRMTANTSGKVTTCGDERGAGTRGATVKTNDSDQHRFQKHPLDVKHLPAR